MKKILFASIIIFLFFLNISCHRNEWIELVETNIESEMPLYGNLEFIFSDKIASTNILKKWDTMSYIEFNPKIPGKFKWETPTKLIFSPFEALNPSTKYTAKIAKQLISAQKSINNLNAIVFKTPHLKLLKTRAYWNNQSSHPILQVDLMFNFETDPEEVIKNLSLSALGKKQTFRFLEKKGKMLSFQVLNVNALDKKVNVNLSINGKIKPVKGNIATNYSFERKFKLKSPYDVTIIDAVTEHDGFEGKIVLFTSHVIEPTQLESYINITPKVDFQTIRTEQGIALISEQFKPETTYGIEIKSGLRGKIGGTLEKSYYKSLTFSPLQPSIQFIDRESFYIAKNGHRNLAIKIINVPEVKVKIYKIYQNNILAFKNNSYYAYKYGDVIWEKNFQTHALMKKGQTRLLKIDFEDKLPDLKGLYYLKVQSTNDYWIRDDQHFSISDIGIIAKKGKEKLYVFTNSIESTKSLSNVKLTLIGKNNQKLSSGKTNDKGTAILKWENHNIKGFEPALIMAQKENDINYITLGNTRIYNDDYDIGGKAMSKSGLEAFIYGERDLYRPGEQVNLSIIVRNQKIDITDPIPLKIKFRYPNGDIYKEIKKTLSEQGSFDAKLNLSPNTVTGTYSADIYTSTDVWLNSYRFLVEEFMPDRIKVNTKLTKKELFIGDSIWLQTQAFNMFGPPAANRNYEVEITLNRENFYAEKYGKYHFNPKKLNIDFKKQRIEGKTDKEGKFKVPFAIPKKYKNQGLLGARFYTTVFDETGRSVSKINELKVYTQEVFYGMQYVNYYHDINKPVRIPLIAVNKKGNAIDGANALIKVIKTDFNTVLASSGSYYRYQSQQKERIIESKEITISGEHTSFSFVPEFSGQYEVRLYLPNTETYISETLYCYGRGYTTYSSFSVNKKGTIDITLDKEKYETGETAKVLLKTPFSGKVLITLENSEVIKHFYVNTDKKSAAVEIPLKDTFIPNTYITATLFRPYKENNNPLTVAHGVAPIMVEKPNTKVPIKIHASEKSRSGNKQSIAIKTLPNAQVTIAVVDEGILQLTNYDTPNPWDYFYRKRPLKVSSYDIYPYLFPEISTSLASTGGDGEASAYNSAKRVNPLVNKRVKLLSFWSGTLTANADGNINYSIDIPKFSGELRIMAVAHKEKAFGAAETSMKVADPIVVSTGLPRFLTPKDTAYAPVTLMNTTNKKATGKISINVDGPIKIVGNKYASININNEDEQQIIFKLVADNTIGQAKVQIDVNALGEIFNDLTELTVRPASSLQKRNGSGIVKAGETQEISINTQDFLSQTTDYQLIISKSPAIQFLDDFEYLVKYPHGCAEQTISKAFPQLYYSEMAQMLNKNGQQSSIKYHIEEAINKIKLSQLYHGGITLWPGGGEANTWLSAYAAHFLIEAKKAGYQIDKDLLDKTLQYLKKELGKKKTIKYYYNRNQNKKIAPKEIAYSLYVLALHGTPQKSTMNYYKSKLDLLSLDAKYLLAAAYALAGDHKNYQKTLPKAFEGEKANPTFGGSFYSYVRDQAIALNTLLEVDPENPQVSILAKRLAHHLKTKEYLNTQERVFGFLAMGKIAQAANQRNISGILKGEKRTIASFSNKTLILNKNELKDTSLSLSANGEGELYYFWSAEGISKDGSYKEEDNYLKVRKEFYDRDGNAIKDFTFEQTKVYIVKISVRSLTNDYIENVVITDLLPASFEIENPRIDAMPDLTWIKNKNIPIHMDIRDDRINLYANIGNKTQHYYYVVRAVGQGDFHMGPISADAMYVEEYHSYHGAHTVKVIERK